MSRAYPFTAYVLTPAMLVKKVDLVSSAWRGIGHKTVSGNVYGNGDLHDTPQAAIAAGHSKIVEQRSKLQVQQANIEKRAANLAKSEAAL